VQIVVKNIFDLMASIEMQMSNGPKPSSVLNNSKAGTKLVISSPSFVGNKPVHWDQGQ